MRTIGIVLKEARLAKRLSVADLENETKIKASFIYAIEEGQWESLPEFSIVTGFVKRLGGSLDIDAKQTTALLRRDYPPKKQVVTQPKPDVGKQFTWSPRLTVVAIVGLIVVMIIGYLGLQYRSFIALPSLTISQPAEGETIKTRQVEVVGMTDPSVSITINDQPVIVNDDGKFVGDLETISGEMKIEVKATSRSGKQTMLSRTINVDR